MKMVSNAKIIVIVFLFSLFAYQAYAGGLGALIEVGKGQDLMNKALDKETETYEAVKKAIGTGNIKEGQLQDFIQKQYGGPVIVTSEKSGMETWVYKPDYATWFDGIKIYLVFDGSRELKEIRSLDKTN